jgi:hypothetical protein
MPESPTIAEYDHFIPIATNDLLGGLTQLAIPTEQQAVIRSLRRLLSFDFYQRLQRFKTEYRPLNPDNELLITNPQPANPQAVVEQVRTLLTQANFSELGREQIEFALEKTSPYGLNIAIDFDAFSEVILFYRGKAHKTIEVRDWSRLGLKKKTTEVISFQRLFLLLVYRDRQKHPGVHLKLFKDILRPDLEMLFPETQVRLKGFDKFKLMITGGGGTAGGLIATISKISAAISPWTIVIALGGFVMLIWRQISKIFTQKTRYMMTLAQNLYFHNMDNNLGAVTYLVDLARQEEIKEACLAYAMICHHNIANNAELDDLCEQYLRDEWGLQLDFDTQDALDKLLRLDLIEVTPRGIAAKPASYSQALLQTAWLDYLSSD